jgi:hypothetical protein
MLKANGLWGAGCEVRGAGCEVARQLALIDRKYSQNFENLLTYITCRYLHSCLTDPGYSEGTGTYNGFLSLNFLRYKNFSCLFFFLLSWLNSS